jgi:hypothetical protein
MIAPTIFREAIDMAYLSALDVWGDTTTSYFRGQAQVLLEGAAAKLRFRVKQSSRFLTPGVYTLRVEDTDGMMLASVSATVPTGVKFADFALPLLGVPDGEVLLVPSGPAPETMPSMSAYRYVDGSAPRPLMGVCDGSFTLMHGTLSDYMLDGAQGAGATTLIVKPAGTTTGEIRLAYYIGNRA